MRKMLFVLFIGLTIVTLGTASAQPAMDQALPQQDDKTAQAPEATDPQQAPAQDAAAKDSESCAPAQAPALELSPTPVFQAGQVCGGVTCGRGEYCCNPSCNICVPYGWSCTQQSC